MTTDPTPPPSGPEAARLEQDAGADTGHAGEHRAGITDNAAQKEDEWDYLKDREIEVTGALLRRAQKKDK